MKEKQHNRISDYYLLTRTYLYIIKRLDKEIIQHFAPSLTGILLDVGCGYKPYMPLFTKTEMCVGLDMALVRKPDIVADVQALPISSEVADSALCSELVEHVLDPDAVVQEVARTLKPSGKLLITAPMSWNLHYEPHDYRRYTCYGLWLLLQANGFDVIETRRIGGLFSLVGSRLVEGIATELFRRLKFLPWRLRHALILCYSIPLSLFFLLLARIGDGFEKTDAIGWAVLARKRENGQGDGPSACR